MNSYFKGNDLTGNCVQLQGTGYLNHFSCTDRFNSGCPMEHYFDEELYRCELAINII